MLQTLHIIEEFCRISFRMGIQNSFEKMFIWSIADFKKKKVKNDSELMQLSRSVPVEYARLRGESSVSQEPAVQCTTN